MDRRKRIDESGAIQEKADQSNHSDIVIEILEQVESVRIREKVQPERNRSHSSRRKRTRSKINIAR